MWGINPSMDLHPRGAFTDLAPCQPEPYDHVPDGINSSGPCGEARKALHHGVMVSLAHNQGHCHSEITFCTYNTLYLSAFGGRSKTLSHHRNRTLTCTALHVQVHHVTHGFHHACVLGEVRCKSSPWIVFADVPRELSWLL